FVDDTHSDALISVMNSPNGSERVREIYGDRVVIVPYVMPGFKLVRSCRELFAESATDRTLGLVLMNHGLFTFGDTVKMSYERMIDLVDRAEQYLAAHDAWKIEWPAPVETKPTARLEIAGLRRAVSEAADAPMIL